MAVPDKIRTKEVEEEMGEKKGKKTELHPLERKFGKEPKANPQDLLNWH